MQIVNHQSPVQQEEPKMDPESKDGVTLAVVIALCITSIEITALIMGHNGTLLLLSFTALGGLIGYKIKNKKKKS